MRKQAEAAFSTRMNFYTNDQYGPAHLKILLHHWGKQRAGLLG
jgi:hypothetical protein